jgi:hypothetical protein
MHKILNKTLSFALTRILIVFLSIFSFFTSSVSGQIITSINPSIVYPGQQHAEITISAIGTSFANGKTSVNMGPGITVTGLSIPNTTTIEAFVNVSPTATPGTNNVTVTTKTNSGNQIVSDPGGITIFQQGGNVHATIQVNPVQNIELSNFNPTTISEAPLLFTVTVYNDAIVQDLNVVVTATGQKLGLLATGTKKFKNAAANSVSTVDNRQFDKYTVANINTAVIQTAIQTGTLPSDVYTYNVVVSDDNGTVLASTSGSNTITNQHGKPELINPGNPLFSDPPLLTTRFPLFQWFGQANSFDFILYEVKPGQKTGPEIILNRPTYLTNNINVTSLLYPAGAAMLEEGHTYAWQIVDNYNGGSGPESIQSDLFWFTVGTLPFTKGTQTLSEIRVIPQEVLVISGQSFKFRLKSIDIQNDTLSIKPIWTVVPAEGGTIDTSGNFTAGIHTKSVAVVATYGGISDYATVDVKNPNEKDQKQNIVVPKKPDSDYNPRLK